MQKTILITGSTDGIGLATAKLLAEQDHNLLLHGRSQSKLEQAKDSISKILNQGSVESFVADLSDLNQVNILAKSLKDTYEKLDVLINNAGVFRTPNPITSDGLDVRFVVNTLAPYLLTQHLLAMMESSGRVLNLSSAAQNSINLEAMSGKTKLDDDFGVYAQSKLAITLWTRNLAMSLGDNGPAIIAVNPGSMLGSKMVKEGFGVDGGDIGIGAEILARAALSEEFGTVSGAYYDNDKKQITTPHHDALDPKTSSEVINTIERILSNYSQYPSS